jgi:hypothetical protein
MRLLLKELVDFSKDIEEKEIRISQEDKKDLRDDIKAINNIKGNFYSYVKHISDHFFG